MPDNPAPRRVDDERDLSELCEVFSAAFAAPAETLRERLNIGGIENVRVIDADGAVAAGLLSIPMGQYFGVRRVDTAGIAFVGAGPQCRGRGLAGQLMRSILQESRQQGMGISTLYPASVALYRRFGYELGGSRFMVRFRPADIDVVDQTLGIQSIGPQDRETVERLYAQWAVQHNGCLDRHAYVWQRVRQHRDCATRGFLVTRDDQPCGYVYYGQERSATGHGQHLTITDLVHTCPEAARCLLAFLAQHRSMVERIDWPTGPGEPLLALLSEKCYSLQLDYNWMVRIVDVAKALTQRGYPSGITGRLALHVHDPLLADNSGRFLLEVDKGAGQVRAGGDGGIELDVQALAAMYSGFLSPHQLASIGWLHGPADDIAQASRIFAGSPPWMPDIF